MNVLAKCLRLNRADFKTCLAAIDITMREFWNPTIFHHYTDHGYDHTQRIIRHLEALLTDYPDLLNQQERFILLASAYLHDVGMQSPEYAELERKIYTEYTLEEIETVRERHHISSGQIILDSVRKGGEDEFSLRTCREHAKYIAEVSRHHTNLNITLLEDTRYLSEEIRLPLLASLMRLGDALDLDSRRVNLDNLRYWDIPVLSQFHWWAHHYVSSVHIEEGRIGLIFSFPDVHRDDPILDEFRMKIEDSIKNHLSEVYPVLFDYKVNVFHEPHVDDVIYDVEGVIQSIPQDLLIYLNERKEELERIQRRTGVDFYVDGAPYSDDPRIAESTARLMQLVDEGRNEAARIEVERCLTFTLSPWHRLIILNFAGNVYQILGDMDGAMQRFMDALSICGRKELIDIYGRDVDDAWGAILGNMGIIFSTRGELDEALKHHEDALKIHREVEYRQGEADNLSNIGLVYREKGDPDEALTLFKEALEITRKIEYRRGEATDLGNIGVIYFDMGERDMALTFFKEALEIYREVGFRQGEAGNLGNIGLIYLDKGELDEALKHSEEALEITREIGYRLGEAHLLSNIGLVYNARGKMDEALIHLEAALEIYLYLQSPKALIIKKILADLKKKDE